MKKILFAILFSFLFLSPHLLLAHKFFPIETGNEWWYLNEENDTVTWSIGKLILGPHWKEAYELSKTSEFYTGEPMSYGGHILSMCSRNQYRRDNKWIVDWDCKGTEIENIDHIIVYRSDQGLILLPDLYVGHRWRTEDRFGVKNSIHYYVVGMNDPIATRMGIFLNCITIKQIIRSLTTHEFYRTYAPGVGLVEEIEKKNTRTERRILRYRVGHHTATVIKNYYDTGIKCEPYNIITKKIINYRIDGFMVNNVTATAYPKQSVNLRQKPTVKSGKISVLSSEDKLTILDFTYNSEDERYWYYVRTPFGLKGWCCANYLSREENIGQAISPKIASSDTINIPLSLHPKGEERLNHKTKLKITE